MMCRIALKIIVGMGRTRTLTDTIVAGDWWLLMGSWRLFYYYTIKFAYIYLFCNTYHVIALSTSILQWFLSTVIRLNPTLAAGLPSPTWPSIYPSQISSSTTSLFPRAPLAFSQHAKLTPISGGALHLPSDLCRAGFLTSFKYPRIHPASEKVSLIRLSISPNQPTYILTLFCFSP